MAEIGRDRKGFGWLDENPSDWPEQDVPISRRAVSKADLESLVMLTPRVARLIAEGLDVAVEEYEYRRTDLADTGDYEPEDIARMERAADAMAKVRDQIAAYFTGVQ